MKNWWSDLSLEWKWKSKVKQWWYLKQSTTCYWALITTLKDILSGTTSKLIQSIMLEYFKVPHSQSNEAW